MSSYSFQGRTRVWVPREEEENLRIFGNGKLDGFMPVEFPEIEDEESDRWSTQKFIKLLRLYGSHRCLWDASDPGVRNRIERRAAMIDITAAMGDDATVELVQSKINFVRSRYRIEKKKIKERIRTGIGPKTKLKWFALADSFLRKAPKAVLRKTEAPDSDSDLEDAVVFTVDPEMVIPFDEDLSVGTKSIVTMGPNHSKMEEDKLDAKNKDGNRRSNRKICFDSSKWNSNTSVKFLKLYRSHQCLWNSNKTEYRDKEKRDAAIRDISEKLGGYLTEKQVIRKINTMRSTYRHVRRTSIERFKRGNTWEPSLKWYALADSFLRPFCQMKLKKNSGKANLGPEPPQMKWEDDSQSEINSDNEHFHTDNFPDQSSPKHCTTNSPDIKKEIESEDDSNLKQSHHSFPIDKEVEKSTKGTTSAMKRSWTKKDSLKFIELYKANPCLWKTSDKQFNDSAAREKSIALIAKAMEYDVEKIKTKIRILKKAYDEEDRKRQEATKKCIPFRSRLPWFYLANRFISSDEPVDICDPINFVDTSILTFPPGPSEPSFAFADTTKSANNPISDPIKSPKVKIEKRDSISDISLDDFDFQSAPRQSARSKSTQSSKKDDFFRAIVPEVKLEVKSEPVASTSASTKAPFKWTPPEDDLLEGKWSLKSSVKFLRLYGSHKCLWDMNHPDYRNRILRDAAFTDIGATMGQGMDIAFVKKKIQTFRLTYMQERRRMVDMLKKDEDPEIQLKWFPLVDCFLRDHIGLKVFKDDPELPQFDFEFVYTNLNMIDHNLLNSFEGKGTQNFIQNESASSEPESDEAPDCSLISGQK